MARPVQHGRGAAATTASPNPGPCGFLPLRRLTGSDGLWTTGWRPCSTAFRLAVPGKEPDGALPGLGDLSADLRDFGDTAGVIALCDLVISADTSVAHLAGAMGKPVWVLLPSNPDWRWLRERTDSPWYPSARLFRQAAWDGWDRVVADVKAALDGQFTR